MNETNRPITKLHEIEQAVFVEKARELYQSDDIEIDDGAKLSETDDGAWVQAWVWVAYDDFAGDDGEAGT